MTPGGWKACPRPAGAGQIVERGLRLRLMGVVAHGIVTDAVAWRRV
jgi:hypothetical protein